MLILSNSAPAHSSEKAHYQIWFFAIVRRTKRFTCHYQGVSRAESPKDKHEYAPIQTGSAICCPLKSVVIEWRRAPVEGLSKCAKKL
jgi:hypothetical protein